ncbi:Pentatricopeptide repeat-containing protein [Apostasia shenzhenica]|uniref:Pentatricopeptide repeat-containing protein n=1 Tax=Apostasia shenzhenica TaxID=1088818 RepID=A0A2I0ARS2_9ASPA|nr:Pentatricopeptide repeat-containing protein [Apostasia shenzhenica]
MYNPCLRQLCSLVDPIKRNPNLSPCKFPVPHRSIPDPCGQDHDLVSVAHSYLIHDDWSKLNALARSLNPFRIKHILLKIRRDPVLSLKFYEWSLNHTPDSQTLETHSVILHILCKFRRFRAAESILRETLLPKVSISELFDSLLYTYRLCESSPNVFDSLFKTYAHLKKFRNATETFCRMRGYGFLPTIRSCNALMSSLLDHGRPDIALSFYRELRRCRISPNGYTLNMIMLAFSSLGRLEKALEVFEKMEAMGFSPTVSSFNTMIAAYCKCRLMNFAVKLKNEMEVKGLDPNVITYNTLIYGFCIEGKLNEANKILSEMKAKDACPNVVTYNILINGYCQMGNGEMGFRIYEEMVKNGVKADIVTFNALISGFCNEGKTKKASYLVKELDSKNLVPNASTFSSLIIGQCKKQNSERAFEIYKAMKKNGCYPNYETFNILIVAFVENKDYEGALEVLKDMLEAWIAPDKMLLTELSEGLHRSGKSRMARRFLSQAGVLRFLPKTFLDLHSCYDELDS